MGIQGSWNLEDVLRSVTDNRPGVPPAVSVPAPEKTVPASLSPSGAPAASPSLGAAKPKASTPGKFRTWAFYAAVDICVFGQYSQSSVVGTRTPRSSGNLDIVALRGVASHPWHDLPYGDGAPDELNVVIEIPAGSKVSGGGFVTTFWTLLLCDSNICAYSNSEKP